MNEELIVTKEGGGGGEPVGLPIQFVEEKPESVLIRFPGLSAQRFTDAQKTILEQAIPADEIDILPTGELYVSQVRYRRILNDAFGPGGWGLVPTGDFQQDAGTLCREFALFAEGRFISSAIGEADFQPNNPRYSKATAAESLKSNALTRCCKDLLIASECWDKRFCETWKKANAVAVWCIGKAGDIAGKKKKLWRRKDAERFEYPWTEQGVPTKPPEPPEDVPSVDLRSDTPVPPTPPEIGPPGATEAKKPPIQTRDDLFLAAMKGFADRDRDLYFKTLGSAGYERAGEVKGRKKQKIVFTLMQEAFGEGGAA